MSLMSALTCISKSSQERLRWQTQASVCLGCKNPFCGCETSEGESAAVFGFTKVTVVKCDCIDGVGAYQCATIIKTSLSTVMILKRQRGRKSHYSKESGFLESNNSRIVQQVEAKSRNPVHKRIF